MFYSDSILARKGPLANIWLAANWDRKLTRGQILQTDLASTVDDLVNGEHPPMALRLQGQLLLGVSKIYGRQARYLLEDCGEALGRLQEHSVTSHKAGATAPATSMAQPRGGALDVKRGAAVPLDRIPEFNVEDFLKSVKPALATPSTPQKRPFQGDEDGEGNMYTPALLHSPEMGMLMSPQANAELLQVLNLSPGQPLPMMSPGQAIEVGRRQSESVRDSAATLPVSPLRSPQFDDQQPQQFEDDWGNNDDDEHAVMGSESSVLPDPQSMLVSPPATKSAKRTRRNALPSKQRRGAVFDEETELEGHGQPHSLPTPSTTGKSNGRMTRKMTKASAQSLMDLLSKPMSGDDAFAELFQEIALSSPLAKKVIDRLAEEGEQDEEEETVDEHQLDENDHLQQFDDAAWEVEVPVVAEQEKPEEAIVDAHNTLMQLLASRKVLHVKQTLADMHATKRQAAHLFFELLRGGLGAKESVEVEQVEPFGEIVVALL